MSVPSTPNPAVTPSPASGVVLITGGSRGIGAAVARQAAAAGYAVVISYVSHAIKAQALTAELTAAGHRALAVQADVRREADILRLFATVDTQVGRLTALVNNAGVVDRKARLDQMSADRLHRMFETNVIGALLCAREAIKRMSTLHGGHGGVIVNVSSAAARLGSPAEYIDYAASKGAIDTMTLGLAREVGAEGIRVNAVRPGLIDTDIHASGGQPDRISKLQHQIPMQRGGSADEVADTILWLMSPQSSYVTGALIDVSGGR